jgi:hypothetical protein
VKLFKTIDFNGDCVLFKIDSLHVYTVWR